LFGAALLFLFLRCGNSEPGFVAEDSLTDQEKEQMLHDELRGLFSAGNDALYIDSMLCLSTAELRRFYEAREFRPFWVDLHAANDLGKNMLGFLDSAWAYGFDPDWFFYGAMRARLDSASNTENYVLQSKYLAQADVLLSNAFFLQTVFIAEGFIDTASMGVALKRDSIPLDLVKYLQETTSENLTARITAYEPDFIEYRLMRKALSRWSAASSKWKDEFSIPESKKDSVGFWTEAKKVLLKMELLDTATVKVDSLVVNALKNLQAAHKLDIDGKPGKQSKWVLETSNYERFLMAALAMEKWRWKNRTMDFQFHINIPSYELHVLRNDSIIYLARVVTGLPDHQTPELRASVRYFTLHPFWNVPHSISTEEILPFVKRDTNYMHKHHYRIFDLKKNPVSIGSVNWKRLSKDYFPYRIRQDGGTWNSLGLIVFWFPNKYDVYLHDTPMKPLFKRDVRPFSHGCMRLQDPFRLGELVWEQQWPKDTVTADTLRNWALKAESEVRYGLKKYIPIEVDYITSTADSLGNIFFHYDVYGRDEKYFAIIRKAFAFGEK
jgi:murein L,D-transpeptidase YcbB/YkuD